MDYLTSYKEMISLRNLADHTMISYCTYISVYLDFIQNTLHKCPSDVTDKDILRFLKKLQDERGLSDRTINAVIAQIHFFQYTYSTNHGIVQESLIVSLIHTCLMFLHRKRQKSSSRPSVISR